MNDRLASNDIGIVGEVIAIVTPVDGGPERIYRTHNIVTDAGDIHYAERGAGETPTNAFDTMELGDSTSGAPGKSSTTSTINLIASTDKVVKATYPKTNDGDSDNTGAAADVVTWTFEYGAADFTSADITDGHIAVAAHGAAAPVLTHFEFSGGSFAKTASDTLKVIVNHTFTGV